MNHLLEFVLKYINNLFNIKLFKNNKILFKNNKILFKNKKILL